MASNTDKFRQIAHFSRFRWGNFFDWLVTLCLGGVIGAFTVSLGGVRADTHVVLMPVFVTLLVLHSIWLAVDRGVPKRLSHVPLLFIPFIVWAGYSIDFISPVPWLGRIELIYGLEAFIFFWVLLNNVRTRAHLWAMIVIALVSAVYAALMGFYQFLQNSGAVAESLAVHSVQLSSDFLGQATGSFADPNSFAVLLLVWLSALLFAGAAPKLPMVLRVFCIYVGTMFIIALAFTQLFWPFVVLAMLFSLVPPTAFRERRKRLLYPIVGIIVLAAVAAAMTWSQPKFSDSFGAVLSSEGEAIRFDLWAESSELFKDAPIMGVGGGAFSTAFSQRGDVSFARLAQTPHNDFLLLLVQYGVVGFVLLVGPLLYLLLVGIRWWKIEPNRMRVTGRKGLVMPSQIFFLSVGLIGFLIFICCVFFSFIVYVPALLLCGIFFLSIMVKSSSNLRVTLPHSTLARVIYLVVGCFLAWAFQSYSLPRLEASAIELETRQRLDHLVEQRVHISGNEGLLLSVIARLEEAALVDPLNADVWIGLSAAHSQRVYQNPSDFESIAQVAIETAQRGLELSDRYAVAWTQLGIAYALGGDSEFAEAALMRALEISPNDSLIHYYIAAFLSNYPARRDAALESVNQALEINGNNAAARRLQQKLLVL